MNHKLPESPRFTASCTCRLILDQISGKWSIMVLAVLDDGPLRFNVIKRSLEGVSQKALTETLRRLERNGLVTRRVLKTSPVGVEYALTPLGTSLKSLYCALHLWTLENSDEIAEAQAQFDGRVDPNLKNKNKGPEGPPTKLEGQSV